MTHPLFDSTIMLLIIFSSVLLAIEDFTVVEAPDGTRHVRDSSRTWWPRCLVREEESPLTNPHGDYYNEKDDR